MVEKVSYPNITLWSIDFHTAPVYDIKHFLRRFNVKVIEKIVSKGCHFTNTCSTADDLKVINETNGIFLDPCPNQLRKDFYEAYKNDAEFQSSDAILCLHAISLCELYMPFGKPLIAIASTRYEIGRYEENRWPVWNSNFIKIANMEDNIVAANNLYDYEYIKYFTPLTNNQMMYLPNLCNYVNVKYNPTKLNEFLLAPVRPKFHPRLTKELNDCFLNFDNLFSNFQNAFSHDYSDFRLFSSPMESDLRIFPIRQLYGAHFEFSDLVQHPAIIFLPYQVSMMSFFEFYSMEIPMIVPSLKFFAKLHFEDSIIQERSWRRVYRNEIVEASVLPRHLNSSSKFLTDPNNDVSLAAIEEWLSLSDFYQFPYVLTFNSWKELFQILITYKRDDWKEVSQKMHACNLERESSHEMKWGTILEKISENKKKRERENQGTPEEHVSQNISELDINSKLSTLYQYQLKEDDCFAQIEVGTGILNSR
jgi:hypothetical protein